MDKVCKELGLTMSAAFNMFAKNLVKRKNINFSLNKELYNGINYKNLFNKLQTDDIDKLDYSDNKEIDDALKIPKKYFEKS